MNETSYPGHFSPGKEHGNPLKRRLHGYQTWSGGFGEEKILVPTRIQRADCVVHSLPTIY